MYLHILSWHLHTLSRSNRVPQSLRAFLMFVMATDIVPSQIRNGDLPMHDSPSQLWPAEVNAGNFACRHDYPMRFFNRQWFLKMLYDQLKYMNRFHMGSRVDRISSQSRAASRSRAKTIDITWGTS